MCPEKELMDKMDKMFAVLYFHTFEGLSNIVTNKNSFCINLFSSCGFNSVCM